LNIVRKVRKNSKALSPVVASIILIAVTVAVSVVVAAWMGGTTIGLMGSAEQVSITNVAFSPGTPDTMDIMVTNSGGNTVTISSAFVNGDSVAITNSTAECALNKSTTNIICLTGTSFDAGTAYTIKLITAKGTSAVYTATYNP
jgi:archaeal type IV pilus assembly protein PilA